MTKKKATAKKKSIKKIVMTTSEIAEKHSHDKSYVNKLIKRLKLPTVRARRSKEKGGDGKLVNALSMKDYATLKNYPGFDSKPLTKSDVLVTMLAGKLGVDLKTIRNEVEKLGGKFESRKAGKGKARKTIPKKLADKITKERSDIVEL